MRVDCLLVFLVAYADIPCKRTHEIDRDRRGARGPLQTLPAISNPSCGAASAARDPSPSLGRTVGVRVRHASLPRINHNFSVSAIIFAAPWDVTRATAVVTKGLPDLFVPHLPHATRSSLAATTYTSHGVQDRSIYGRRSKSITLSSFVHPF